MAASPLSEAVRNATKNANLRPSYGIHSYYNQAGDHVVTQVGAGVLYGHLTTGTRDSFINDEEVLAVDTKLFLPDTETQEVIDLLANSAEESGKSDLSKDLRGLTDPTHLAFGAIVPTPEDEEEDQAWVLGGLLYEEPSERLVGPQHRDMTPNQFHREFLERGGKFYTVDPPEKYAPHFQVALNHFAKKHGGKSTTDG